jgi:hypothetical protein
MKGLFEETDDNIRQRATKALEAGKISHNEFKKIESVLEAKFTESDSNCTYGNLLSLDPDNMDAWSKGVESVLADYKLPAKPAAKDDGLIQLQLKIIADLSNPSVKSAIDVARILKKHLDAMITMIE